MDKAFEGTITRLDLDRGECRIAGVECFLLQPLVMRAKQLFMEGRRCRAEAINTGSRPLIISLERLDA